MIRYLIKFVSCEEYAESLLNGNLFMHCARYYHALERQQGAGQGDLREGIVFPEFPMYMNLDLPVFCLYMVEDTDIVDGAIIIEKRVVKDFNCENGYLVLIDFSEFQKSLKTCSTDGFEMVGRKVIYGTPTAELSSELLVKQSIDNLFIKDTFFKHQKEYRLIVEKTIPKVYKQKAFGGRLLDVIDEQSMHITYSIPEGIRNIAKEIAVQGLLQDEQRYVLRLN